MRGPSGPVAASGWTGGARRWGPRGPSRRDGTGRGRLRGGLRPAVRLVPLENQSRMSRVFGHEIDRADVVFRRRGWLPGPRARSKSAEQHGSQRAPGGGATAARSPTHTAGHRRASRSRPGLREGSARSTPTGNRTPWRTGRTPRHTAGLDPPRALRRTCRRDPRWRRTAQALLGGATLSTTSIDVAGIVAPVRPGTRRPRRVTFGPAAAGAIGKPACRRQHRRAHWPAHPGVRVTSARSSSVTSCLARETRRSPPRLRPSTRVGHGLMHCTVNVPASAP